MSNEEVCKHRWVTMPDDSCHCILCMEDYGDYNVKEQIRYTKKMADMIYNARTVLNLSQQKFANFLGVDSARTIRYYESGERQLPIWVSNKIIELSKTQPK